MVKPIKNANKIKYKVKELEVHPDKRGWLVEMLKRNELKEDIKQIYVATIKPGCVRGNHYHLKRTEWFFIIGEKADLYLEDLKTKEKIYFELSFKKPKTVTVFPKIAHAIKNSSKQTIYLISAQNTIYNPKNPDTFFYPLMQ
jgi:UDP-2-acetamido-2,6-beta-L-arabino-hexul-4-ose reductase